MTRRRAIAGIALSLIAACTDPAPDPGATTDADPCACLAGDGIADVACLATTLALDAGTCVALRCEQPSGEIWRAHACAPGSDS